MKYIIKPLNYIKTNKNKIAYVKIMALVLMNTWLLIIFFKILIVENVKILNELKQEVLTEIKSSSTILTAIHNLLESIKTITGKGLTDSQYENLLNKKKWKIK